MSSALLRSSNSKYTKRIELSNAVQVDKTSCDGHHRLLDCSGTDLDDDDVMNETTDDEWCTSDKENNVVFPFPHTESVIAMERIFAQQRLPNFIRPTGYISPLRYPTLFRSGPVPSHVSSHSLLSDVSLFAALLISCSSVLYGPDLSFLCYFLALPGVLFL